MPKGTVVFPVGSLQVCRPCGAVVHPVSDDLLACGHARVPSELSSLFGRQWANRIEKHSTEASRRWGDGYEPSMWVAVLTEEVGKLARATNKLGIADDAEVRSQWKREIDHRLITVASVARRMAERWTDAIETPGEEAPGR